MVATKYSLPRRNWKHGIVDLHVSKVILTEGRPIQCMEHKDELSMTNNRHPQCSPTLVIFVESKKGIVKRQTPHSQPISFPRRGNKQRLKCRSLLMGFRSGRRRDLNQIERCLCLSRMPERAGRMSSPRVRQQTNRVTRDIRQSIRLSLFYL